MENTLQKNKNIDTLHPRVSPRSFGFSDQLKQMLLLFFFYLIGSGLNGTLRCNKNRKITFE